MSLYKDASLVMLPSAVKDGKLYSIRPTDGSGDFTFSRGSNLAATRVDVNGLIEKGRENLLTYSNDFSQWSVISTSINDGQTGYDGSSDAWILEATSAGSGRRIQKTISVSGVQTYSFYAKAGSANWSVIGSTNFAQYFDLQNGIVGTGIGAVVDATIESVGSGWYRCSMTESSSSSTFQIYVANADSNTSVSIGDSIYIQDAQLEQGLVATDYIETGASAAQAGILEDLPRLDYSGGASCPSLLLEPQRTNSVTQSEYFGSSYWTKAGDVTLTSNYGTSPEGLTNADRIVANASSGGHIVYRNINTTGTHTISIFAKASGYNHLFLGYDGGSLNFGIVFNLSNGTISQNPASLTGSIEAVGSNGWYRCNLTFNYATTNYYFVAAPHDNSGNYNWTGNGTDGILIYGAQIELNSSYPTSYIPTMGSAVTRSYDSCEKTGIGSLFGTTGSTIYFETTYYPETNNGQGERWVYAQGNSSSDYIRLWQDVTGGTKRIRALVGAGGIQQVNITTTATSLGLSNTEPSVIKYAFAFAENDFRMYVNGIVRTDNFGTIPTLTEIKFNSVFQTLFPLKQALVFPTALTDSECIALTTI